MDVYYLGPEKSYSYMLAKQSFPEDDLIACKDFFEIEEKVKNNKESIGVLPIENSITSSVSQNTEKIFRGELYIIGESFLKIDLSLVGFSGVNLHDLKTVYSHPKALMQCSNFIKKHNLLTVETASTSAAKDRILLLDKKENCFIGNASLIQKGLSIIENNIGNEDYNYTHFLFVSGDRPDEYPKDCDKLSIKFRTKHEPGALAKILTSIGDIGVNLTKIESRPIPGTEWEYDFWMDLDYSGHGLNEVLKMIGEATLEHYVLGVYKKGKKYNS